MRLVRYTALKNIEGRFGTPGIKAGESFTIVVNSGSPVEKQYNNGWVDISNHLDKLGYDHIINNLNDFLVEDLGEAK